MDNILLDALKQKIKSATVEVIADLSRDFSADQVCAFGLYSDTDARTLAPAVNLKSNLESMQADDPDDAIYYKWAPAEWSHEAYGADKFNDISEELATLSDAVSEGHDFESHCERVFQLCVDVLDELRGEFLNGKIVVFAVSDMICPEWECKWIFQLNSKAEAEEFKVWINSI